MDESPAESAATQICLTADAASVRVGVATLPEAGAPDTFVVLDVAQPEVDKSWTLLTPAEAQDLARALLEHAARCP